MKTKSRLLALALLTSAALPVASAAEPDGDPRHRLGMTPAERVEFLAEMRQMLTSIQGIIAGIGTEDRERIAAAARYSGNRMARATPDSLRRRLPREFQEIGGPTHMLFEEIAIRAETDDMADLAVLTGQTMQQCLACHAMFRAD
ncbi:hypothetical protein [Sulfurivermis fontis]|jgi:cytochrome c556|uniref:hypothetical protein n=1 Tax=Sulfurivermis fontis TaxID=1972068 RepID=UPI000FD870D9|nr:hypothetical protein [Sulfurivermis fontis]